MHSRVCTTDTPSLCVCCLSAASRPPLGCLSAASRLLQVEDTENEHIYHKELFVLTKQAKDEPHALHFTIPLFEPLPPCYFVRAISNRWLGVETIVPLPLSELTLPSAEPAHTELLDLRPLPKSVLLEPR